MAARGRRLGPPPTAAKSWQALSAKAAKPVAPTDPLAQSFARGVELHKAGKLREAGLLAVEAQGRHRYFRIADADVAQLLESMMGVAFGTGAPLLVTVPRIVDVVS